MGFFDDLLGGPDDSSADATKKDNKRRQDFIEEQTGLAIQDLYHLFPQGDQYRTDAYNMALALMGNALGPQMEMYQGGNVAAQNQLLAAMPQYQNAILGMPVDNSVLQPYQGQLPDPSLYQYQLPENNIQYQPPEQQAAQQQGINPLQAANTYNQVAPQFGGQPLWGGAAGSATGTGGWLGGSGTTAGAALEGIGVPAAAAQGGGAAGGTAGSGFGGMAAAAGPWAALAAAIAGAEYNAAKNDRRGGSQGGHIGEVFTGKNLELDMDALADSKYGDAIPGTSGAIKFMGKALNPEGAYEMSNTGIKKGYDYISSLLGGLF